jgi:hypothetical protein
MYDIKIMSDNSLVAFKAISTFTNDLGSIFADKQHSLRLYCHLLNKTTLAHERAIRKHMEAFRSFCVENREAILSKDETKFIGNNVVKITKKIKNDRIVRIKYSENVYIDIDLIFKEADKETKQVIWKHLLVISALLDPTGNAKELLKASKGKEADFLSNIISKVEEHVKPDSKNPMEAISSIMSSGVFGDILSGMNDGLSDGSLDLTKLMTSVSSMVTGLSSAAGVENKEQTEAINTMMSSLMSTISQSKGEGEKDGEPKAMPDMNAILGPLLSSLQPKTTEDGGGVNGGQPDLSKMLGPLMSTLSKSGGDTTSTPDIMSLISGMSGLMGEEKTLEEKLDEEFQNAKKNNKIEDCE